jgi:signal transduction histidine kinase
MVFAFKLSILRPVFSITYQTYNTKVKHALDRSSGWIFYLISGLLLGSTLFRSLYAYRNSTTQVQILGLLAIWLILFASEKLMSARWPGYFPYYLIIQSGLIILLLKMPYPSDYFAALFPPLSMQCIQRFSLRFGAIGIGFFTLIIMIFLGGTYGWAQAITLAGIYTVVSIFLAFYTLTSQRAQEARDRNQILAQELQTTNQQLEEVFEQQERFAIARERQRLARDLHDSVTQSIFSMTLTTQTALLWLDRDPSRVDELLERLKHLAQGAISEMQVLISEAPPAKFTEGGFIANLRQYLTDCQHPDTLEIRLDVDGLQSLSNAEEQNLFRIAQEAVNNIVKHSGATLAEICLHLADPIWMEISDNGQGFDLQGVRKAGHLGLINMEERANEIGWDFHFSTSLETGTSVRVAKRLSTKRQAE